MDVWRYGKRVVGKALRRAERWAFPPPVEPDWKQILKSDRTRWSEISKAAKGGLRVLIATSVGGHKPAMPMESLLAVALTLRGADVHFLLCDGVLPACMQATIGQFRDQSEFVRHGPVRSLCDNCFAIGYATYRPLGLPVHRYSRLITRTERRMADELSVSIPLSDIGDFRLDGLAVGEHALAGALRYFAKGDLGDEPYGEAVLRRYLEASLLTMYALRRLVDSFEFKVACFHHGIYVPQGVVGEVVRRREGRVVNWHTAYRKPCFIFSHHDCYHHTLMSEPPALWENMRWTPELESQVMDYLESRRRGTRDWISFHEKPEEDLAAIARDLGIDFSKPCVGLLTNVVWDAQLHYPANAFPNMLQWVMETISYFMKRPDLQLIIRVHPAEVRGTLPSRQPVVEEIRKLFPVLPENIIVIPPECPVSTYTVMEQCDSVIIYGTKTGVELSSLGIPIIVAGEAWIRNKGLTLDAHTAEQYFQLLDRLPLGERMGEASIRRARMYAYHFFFRRMIPLSMMEPTTSWPPYHLRISGLDDLMPGRDAGLDVICQGILEGSDFVYPAELEDPSPLSV